MSFLKSIGSIRWRASPLPLPQGMMPNAVSEFVMPRATSFTVPSPPTATTTSTPSSFHSFAISSAWPACSVKHLLNECRYTRFADSTRNGVYDEYYFFLLISHYVANIQKVVHKCILFSKYFSLSEVFYKNCEELHIFFVTLQPKM